MTGMVVAGGRGGAGGDGVGWGWGRCYVQFTHGVVCTVNHQTTADAVNPITLRLGFVFPGDWLSNILRSRNFR